MAMTELLQDRQGDIQTVRLADYIAETAMSRPDTLVENPTLLPHAVNFSLEAVAAYHGELGFFGNESIEANKNKRLVELQETTSNLGHSDKKVRQGAKDHIEMVLKNGAEIWNNLQEKSREKIHQAFDPNYSLRAVEVFDRNSAAHGD